MAQYEELRAAYEEIDRLRAGLAAICNMTDIRVEAREVDPIGVVGRINDIADTMLDEWVTS